MRSAGSIAFARWLAARGHPYRCLLSIAALSTAIVVPQTTAEA
jgi:hypothetical protein